MLLVGVVGASARQDPCSRLRCGWCDADYIDALWWVILFLLLWVLHCMGWGCFLELNY